MIDWVVKQEYNYQLNIKWNELLTVNGYVSHACYSSNYLQKKHGTVMSD